LCLRVDVNSKGRKLILQKSKIRKRRKNKLGVSKCLFFRTCQQITSGKNCAYFH
jgi:hypothetical protein